VLDVTLLAVGALGLLVATFFEGFERLSITPPLLGMVVGILLGPEVLGLLHLDLADQLPLMETASRLLLAVALMGAALRYPFDEVRTRTREVAGFILVVMPVMALVVAAAGAWLLALPVAVAAVLGACLAPTDPVLASGIVTGEAAARDIPRHDRQILSLESGANDGLVQPLVLVTLAVALEASAVQELAFVTYGLVGAVVVGALLGTGAGRALSWAEAHREIGPAVRSLYALVLAVLLVGLAAVLHLDAFLAVFVGGLAHNRVISQGDREAEVAIDEALNHFLVIPVFLLFGVILPWGDWAGLGWGGLALVIVALTVRRLPVTLLVGRGFGLTWPQSTWLGWFGPIGVAALYYLAHAVERGLTAPTVWAAGTLVVAVSTVVHGATAAPSRLLYRRHAAAHR
jgi:sodium/hydrogen antiporter